MSDQPATAAWIEAGYWRLGGAGMSEPLWCCPRCYAATPKPTEHDEWHETLRASAGPMGFLAGGRL